MAAGFGTSGGGAAFVSGLATTGSEETAWHCDCLAIDSLKHLEHIPPVEGLPKKPQPEAQSVGAVFICSSLAGVALPSAEAIFLERERCKLISARRIRTVGCQRKSN